MDQSASSTALSFFRPVAMLGGLGAFIDFLLGDKGQQQVREWLLVKWIYFDDLKWSTFTTREGGLFISISDSLFGKHLLGTKRLVVCTMVTALCAVCWLFYAWQFAGYSLRIEIGDFLARAIYSAPIELAMAIMFLTVSISVTRKITDAAVAISGEVARLGFLIFLGLLLFHILLLITWSPLVQFLRDTVVNSTRVLPAQCIFWVSRLRSAG